MTSFSKKIFFSLLFLGLTLLLVKGLGFFLNDNTAFSQTFWPVAQEQVGPNVSTASVMSAVKSTAQKFNIAISEWGILGKFKTRLLSKLFFKQIFAQTLPGDNTAISLVWHEADDIEFGRGYTLKAGIDIDQDGWGEILVYERDGNSSTLYKISLFEADGDNSYSEMWFYQFDPSDIACPFIGFEVTDWDNDGRSEITAIICTIEGVDNLYVWEWDGTNNGLPSIPTVTFDVPRDTGGVVALENNVQYLQMDDDANLEMVLTHRGGNSTFLQILELSNSDFGSPVWNVEFTDDWVGAKNTGFGITDIDRDDHKEIIMFDDITGQVRVYENTGTDAYTVVNTWTPNPTDWVAGARIKSRIISADFDANTVDELYLSDTKGNTWVITPNGNVATMFDDTNWTLLHDWKAGNVYNEGGDIRSGFSGDVDNDNNPDIYFAGNNFASILDIEYDGGDVTSIDSYSFYVTAIVANDDVEGGYFARPSNIALSDMDGDDHQEIVAIVPWAGANPVENLLGLYVFEQDLITPPPPPPSGNFWTMGMTF